MDKIRIDFFDILGYLIPGSALLLVGWVAADGTVQSPWQAYESIHKADQRSALIGLFLAYIIGFMLHALGSTLYDFYCKRRGVFQQKAGASDLTVQDKWALVRDRGEKHIPVLERWYALRALAQNLAAVTLIGSGVCVYKWMLYARWDWLLFAFLHLALTLLLLRRSEIFHRYLNLDLEAVIRRVG